MIDNDFKFLVVYDFRSKVNHSHHFVKDEAELFDFICRLKESPDHELKQVYVTSFEPVNKMFLNTLLSKEEQTRKSREDLRLKRNEEALKATNKYLMECEYKRLEKGLGPYDGAGEGDWNK